MKVAIICSGAEPGRDGVGDYSVRLGAALVAQGHRVLIIAERDFAVSAAHPVNGEREGVPVLRLPASVSSEHRARALADALDRFAADWVIVQFVCWGFADHGVLDPPLSALTAVLSGRRLAIYCHELWLGLERGASLRHRLWGRRQRKSILRFLSGLQPTLVMTSNTVYADVLRHFGWCSRMVPLFSNIPYHPEGGAKFLSLLAERAGQPLWSARSEIVMVAVFGSLDHPRWHPQAALRWVSTEAQRRNRKVLLVVVGRRSPRDERFAQRLASEVGSFARALVLGEVTPEVVSGMLQEADIGLPACDWLRLGKSGVAAAMTAHGLPMLVVRNDESYRDLPGLAVTHAPSVFRFDAAATPDFDRIAMARTRAADTLPDITRQLLAALEDVNLSHSAGTVPRLSWKT
jgi:glycosyl transferase family 4